MKKIKLGDRWIGQGEPCFIIAEAGSNHDGKLEQAKQLIDIAVEAGADAVKFQTYSAEKLYSRKTSTVKYLKKDKLIRGNESVWDLIKKIEMPRKWHKPLAGYCKEKGIIFLSTPFDLEAVDEFEEVGMVAYKIASFEIVHLPLLEYVTKRGKITKTDIQDPTYFRHVSLGWNYRMSELQSAVLLGQLERVDELVEVRVKVAELFNHIIDDVN